MKTILPIQESGSWSPGRGYITINESENNEMDTFLKYKNVLRAKKSNGNILTFGTMHSIGHLLISGQ